MEVNEDLQTIRNLKQLGLDWLRNAELSALDKLWALLQSEIIPECDLHELACVYVERGLGREPDSRALTAVAVRRRWITGAATDAELAAAWSTPNSAGKSVAWWAAWFATRAQGDAAEYEWQLDRAFEIAEARERLAEWG